MKKASLKFFIFYTLLMLFLVLNITCASKKELANNVSKEDINSKLIFLNYVISKNENNEKNIQFINKTVTDGKLKGTAKLQEMGTIGDLKCSQLSKDSVEIKSIIVKNPLSKTIEYVNDSLIFESKKIDLQKTAFTLRLQLHSKTAFIAINEITDSLQNNKSLIITKLD